MSIRVVSLPDKYSFSRNPIVLKVAADKRLSTAGKYWTQSITFINAPTTPGELFSVSWDSIDVEMLSMAAPITEDGTKYRLMDGGELLADFVAHFAEDIGYNYYIGSNYTIEFTTDTITITAKKKGSKWNMTLVDIPGTVTTDYTLGTEILGVDTVVRDNYKVFLEIWDVEENEMKFTAEMLHLSDNFSFILYNNSSYEIRLEKILHQLHSLIVMQPETEVAMQMVTDYLFRCYFLRYYESYGSPAVAKNYYLQQNSGDYFYTLRGGLNAKQWIANTFWADYDTPNYIYLTWQPRTKKVVANQPEWLAFIHTLPEGFENGGYAKFIITYTDATTSTHTTIQQFTNTSGRSAMFFVVCGYFQVVEAAKTMGKTVDYWTVQIFGDRPSLSPLAISEVFTYKLMENDVRDFTKYVVFNNSLGGYDTLACTGKSITGMDITGIVLNEWMDADYEMSDAVFSSSDSSSVETYNMNTGFLSRKIMIVWLQELLTAQKALFVTQNGTSIDCEFDPVIVIKKSVKIFKDWDDQDSFYINFDLMSANEFVGTSEILS